MSVALGTTASPMEAFFFVNGILALKTSGGANHGTL